MHLFVIVLTAFRSLVSGNPLPPKKTYDMDGNEIEPEEEELVTESETTLTEVDYGLLMLFIGQFTLDWILR